ncbi:MULTISPECIES: hypothetical protein [Mucilaginibacter]|uniref:Uncharacterized protein n=1 Tax=Mucilaginibacter rubeus TaxID=2027860 RepID=A0ABX7UE30_9SPHI|nr:MULTISPECIES: hypothetical protein [Mucilaginibacter]QTE44442.1 hypothetical protein J3L19_03440 [Mucilaginibacter rubeus]QTE51041.1 hypothetical protein J3L21_03415 [Mucilaginibacter rubeus]QTE56124.1 hypothetical protein J3L23_28655 [Mucilaginibacter rubeus]QTE64411.1 hypothetical protein J3L22_05170 [Mucilaginibacter rubeus]QTF63172.1 hypothetical protein J3L20_04855 [Mucilaginibacter rubeus]
MTRSNLHITLSNGDKLQCVADSSSAPEQGYIVEHLLLPLLSFSDAKKELALITEHCTMDEQRTNAEYRYLIDLKNEHIEFYEEHYNQSKNTFKRGINLTGRYISYLKKLETETELFTKRKFRDVSNKELVKRINGLPDFKWDDEGVELHRRSLLSNGAFIYKMQGNTLIILKDEKPQ